MTDPFQLIDAYYDGTLTDEQGAALSAWVKESPANARIFARESFVHQRVRDLTAGQILSDQIMDEICETTCETSTVETSTATVQVRRDAADISHRIPKRHLGFWLSTSLSIVFASVIFAWAKLDQWSTEQPFVEEHDVAFVAVAEDVNWTLSTMTSRVGDRLGPDVVRFDSGFMRLDFSNGVIVELEGAVQFDVMSSKKTLVRSGKATVTGPRNRVGFQVMTTTTDVVDRVGSQFGVEAGPSGETNIVVFSGAVEVSYIVPNTNGRSRGRFYLEGGESVCITQSGDITRLASVAYNPASGKWDVGPSADQTAIIASVADRDRASEDPKHYRVVRRGLAEDARAFVDRFDQWNGVDKNGLPEELLDADLIQVFNDRGGESASEVVVQLARPAMLYVFADDTAAPPQWLSATFTNTNLKVGLDRLQQHNGVQPAFGSGPGKSIDRIFSVWKREVPRAQAVSLGSTTKDGNFDEATIFGVAATALDRE